MENRSQSVTESTRLAQQTLICRIGNEFDAQEENEEDVEELEDEVNEMAQMILNYRSTFSDQLSSGLAAVFAAERPEFPVFNRDYGPAFSGDMDKHQGSHGESCEGVIAVVEDQESTSGISLMKEKISSNVSAMPLVLKRMNECMSRINKLSSRKDIIHPALKRKRNRSLSKP